MILIYPHIILNLDTELGSDIESIIKVLVMDLLINNHAYMIKNQ